MLEAFHHHPLLLNQDTRRRLPETRWDLKIGERYPIGSDIELTRRAQALFYRGLAYINGNLDIVNDSILQPAPELLEGITEMAIDIVAPAFTVEHHGQRKTVLIIEDHVHQAETNYTMGKSSIVQKLLGFPPVDEVVRENLDIAPGIRVTLEDLLRKVNEHAFTSRDIQLNQVANSNVRLLTGDVTFIGRTAEDKLVAMPMIGTREDFIFDIARTAVRRILKEYNRVDENIMETQIRLTEKIRLPASIWEDTKRVYPVDETIFLSPNPGIEGSAEWGENVVDQDTGIMELYAQLKQNPLYLAGEIGYWDINPEVHARVVDALFIQPFKSIPTVLYLFLKNPKDPQVLDEATDLIKERYKN